MSVSDDDWMAVVKNLRWAQKKWERMIRVLGREGAYSWMLGVFYIAVVKAVLLYGSETWVMSLFIGRTLGGFHHRVDLRLTRW